MLNAHDDERELQQYKPQ